MTIRTKLTLALAVQVIAAGALYLNSQASQQSASNEPWLDFAVTDATKLVISDGTNTATLNKQGEQWQLPALSALPVQASKLDSLLNSLKALSTRWPVANTASGRERFEVTDEKFQRHLQIYNGDTLLGDYYFGTSPGFRQTHGRRADQDEVYALNFNNFDLPAADTDWLDKGLLRAPNLTSITGSDFSLTKNGDSWQFTTPPADATQQLDDSKVLGLVSVLQNLQVQKLADSAPTGETHSLSASDGSSTWTFQFTKAGDQYFVQRNDRPQHFTLTATDYERSGGITLAGLLKAAPTGEAAAPALNLDAPQIVPPAATP